MGKPITTVVRSALTVCMATLAGTACADDIVETAVKAGNFTTLATALTEAELVETLQGPGPFTVFAPTDEAFAKLPADAIATLLQPENRGTLTGILTFHVVSGKLNAEEVLARTGLQTVNGQRLDVSTSTGVATIDGATIVTTDIECDNGVIHVIDAVLMPVGKKIPEVATAAGTFGTLLAAAKAAGLVDALNGAGPLTLFAPTDDAFAKLPAGTVESLLKPENKQNLIDILKFHVVAGRLPSEAVVASKSAQSLLGPSLMFNAGPQGVTISGAMLVAADIDAANGVIHVVDTVLLPPAKPVDPQQQLYDAVIAGAPMFNHGDHAGCARVYETTLTRLMESNLDASYKQYMQGVLRTASQQHSASDRAWTLRRGIDQMALRLSRGE